MGARRDHGVLTRSMPTRDMPECVNRRLPPLASRLGPSGSWKRVPIAHAAGPVRNRDDSAQRAPRSGPGSGSDSAWLIPPSARCGALREAGTMRDDARPGPRARGRSSREWLSSTFKPPWLRVAPSATTLAPLLNVWPTPILAGCLRPRNGVNRERLAYAVARSTHLEAGTTA
jgi:hypothetical protein